MKVLNFHIFDRGGICRFSLNPLEAPDQVKTLSGFLYSLKKFTFRMSPMLDLENNYFFYSTSGYHLAFYELPTSIKFVLLLSEDMPQNGQLYRALMTAIYQVFVEFVVKNPLIDLLHSPQVIDSALFRKKLNDVLVHYQSIYSEL